MYMRRSIEETICDWWQAGHSRPLLVRGPRRVGKTRTICHVGEQLVGNDLVVLDFQTDTAAMERIFSAPTDNLGLITKNISDYVRRPVTKESSLLFFDEVQLNERALNSLRFFSGSGWAVIASGSLLGVSARKRSLPFPSGVEQIDMHPMTFEEYLWAIGETHMADAIREHSATLEPFVLHDQALEHFARYQVLGGMPKPVVTHIESQSFSAARQMQAEIDQTYVADMTDPENGISGISALRIWNSIPSQLMRSSTKKFKYSEVVRGGRRQRLLEPLEWLSAAGVVTKNDMTQSTTWPLVAYDDEEGSFFKIYMGDTGIMFRKFGVSPELYLQEGALSPVLSSDFRGALAENVVMQALHANNLRTFYWTPPSAWGGRGEIDFVLQTNAGELVPVEVKSGRNVSAKTMRSFVSHGLAPYAVMLSSNQYGRGVVEGTEVEVRHLPLYAAHCVGEDCVAST